MCVVSIFKCIDATVTKPKRVSLKTYSPSKKGVPVLPYRILVEVLHRNLPCTPPRECSSGWRQSNSARMLGYLLIRRVALQMMIIFGKSWHDSRQRNRIQFPRFFSFVKVVIVWEHIYMLFLGTLCGLIRFMDSHALHFMINCEMFLDSYLLWKWS